MNEIGKFSQWIDWSGPRNLLASADSTGSVDIFDIRAFDPKIATEKVHGGLDIN